MRFSRSTYLLMCLSLETSTGSPARLVIQIRRKESVDKLTREVTEELDLTSALHVSQSFNETSWLREKVHHSYSGDLTTPTRDKLDCCGGLLMPAHIPSIPSTVRFIDKLYQQNRSLSPSPIVVTLSPKQQTLRHRSISPCNLRPSLLPRSMHFTHQ